MDLVHTIYRATIGISITQFASLLSDMLLLFTSLFQTVNSLHDRNRKTSLAGQESTQ